MLLSLKANNCLIYNSEVEFSMQADMRYKRFPNNVAQIGDVNILKTAILIGPNNSGKTSFIRIIEMLKDLMLGKEISISKNLFSDNPIVDISISFVESGAENLFEIKYDTSKREFVYERFAQLVRDEHKNIKTINLLIRDIKNKVFCSEEQELTEAMKVSAKNNILIYLLDTEKFLGLN